jgi:hypothetical protein
VLPSNALFTVDSFPFDRISRVHYVYQKRTLHDLNTHLIVDLLHGLGQVRLELVVGVGRLMHPLLQGRVGVVPRGPHVVGALRHQ